MKKHPTPPFPPLTGSPATGEWDGVVTHDGLFVVDHNQRIVFWSSSAQRILGYQPEDVLGQPCYEAVGGRDSRNFRFCRRNCPVMVNARRGRPTPNFDILCPVKGRGECWINVSVVLTPVRGKCLHVVHFFRDVTGRRRSEEFARKAAEALRQLLGKEDMGLAEEVALNPTPLPKLSRRESEVLRLLAAGVSTRQIADTLGVQPVTARNHITRLVTKLGVRNRLQAVVYASQHRLI